MTISNEMSIAIKLAELKKNIKVYIASPYTLGNKEKNVRVQVDMADKLMNLGYSPYVPLLNHYQHIVHKRPENEWLDHDLVWVQQCDVLLRLEGESSGADGEELAAELLGIPVVYSLEELMDLV